MSTGTNRERIEQNNLKLEEIKNQVNNLPEYQNIKEIKRTVDMSEEYRTSASNPYSVDNISSIGDYVFIPYCSPSGETPGTIKIYNKGVLESTGTYSNWVSNTNVTNALLTPIKFSKDNTKIYLCCPYATTTRANGLSYGYYDTVSKTLVYLGKATLPYKMYYFDNTTSAGKGPRYYSDEYVVMPSNMSSGNYEFRLLKFDEDALTFTPASVNIYWGVLLTKNWVIPSNNTSAIYHLNILSSDITATSYSLSKNIHGITYDENRVFAEGNIYEFNNGSIGALIKENAYDPSVSTIIKPVNDLYYFYGTSLYKLTDNKLELAVSNVYYDGVSVIKLASDTLTKYKFINDEISVGIVYDNSLYLFPQEPVLSSSDIKAGSYSYTIDGGKVIGTMIDNGELNYIPSTEVQTIPVGYTSGGTISAVDATIDENIVAENIKSGVTILGVTGTFEATAEVQEQVETLTQENETLTTTVDESNAIAEDILGTNT